MSGEILERLRFERNSESTLVLNPQTLTHGVHETLKQAQ